MAVSITTLVGTETTTMAIEKEVETASEMEVLVDWKVARFEDRIV
jgi:hypothetical protein